jgi:hypothetical protein
VSACDDAETSSVIIIASRKIEYTHTRNLDHIKGLTLGKYGNPEIRKA